MTNTKEQWQIAYIKDEKHDIERRLKDEHVLLSDSESCVKVHKDRIGQLEAQLELINTVLQKFASCAQKGEQ